MNGLTTDLAGLDACRRAMLEQAGQFGGISDGFSGCSVDAAIFGTLPAAGRLANLAQQIDSAAGRQFAAAEKFLRAVERGLDEVHQGITGTEYMNVSAIQAI